MNRSLIANEGCPHWEQPSWHIYSARLVYTGSGKGSSPTNRFQLSTSSRRICEIRPAENFSPLRSGSLPRNDCRDMQNQAHKRDQRQQTKQGNAYQTIAVNALVHRET